MPSLLLSGGQTRCGKNSSHWFDYVDDAQKTRQSDCLKQFSYAVFDDYTIKVRIALKRGRHPIKSTWEPSRIPGGIRARAAYSFAKRRLVSLSKELH
jgi:hypothetical protein